MFQVNHIKNDMQVSYCTVKKEVQKEKKGTGGFFFIRCSVQIVDFMSVLPSAIDL